MRWLPWIIQVGPNSNHQYLYGREAERDLVCTGEEAVWPRRLRLEPCGPESRNACSCQNVEEAGSRFSLRASAANIALWVHWFWLSETDFGLLISRTVKEYIFAVLRFQVCGKLIWWPQETNAGSEFSPVTLLLTYTLVCSIIIIPEAS